MAKENKSLAQSIEDAGIYQILKTPEGFVVEKLQKGYSSETVAWSYEVSFKTLKKAKKELKRLTKGRVF